MHRFFSRLPPFGLAHGDRDVELSQDIRLSASTRFRRASWLNILRVLLLLSTDFLLLQLSTEVLRAAYPPGFQGLQQALQQGLQQLYGGHGLWVLVSLTLISVGGGYRVGGAAQRYHRLVLSLWLASLLCAAALFSEISTPEHPQMAKLLLLLVLISVWQGVLLYLGRQLITQVVSRLRHRNIACYSVLIIAETWNQNAICSLVESQGRYQVVRVENSTVLDRAHRAALLSQVLSEGIDEVVIDWSSIRRRLFLLQYLRASKATIRLLPVESNLALDRLKLLNADPLTTYTLPVESPFFSRFSIKRCCDFTVSAVALILLSPLLLTVALWIKLDSPGPVLYRQTRIGLKGRKFEVWKFRSMVANAEQLQEKLESMNESSDGVLFKIRQDPRITRVGRFIRRYSIDELPQLFNVLCGQMSLVGPRPLPTRDVQRFSQESFLIRNEVLPGITGLWQVSGRSDIEDFEDAFHLDMDYIENWSLGLDFYILLKTIAVVLFPKGAY